MRKGYATLFSHRNAQEAGIELDGMQLEDVAKVATQIFTHIRSTPLSLGLSSPRH